MGNEQHEAGTAKKRKSRLEGLDLLRTLLMLTIFLFHSRQRLACGFGCLTTFISIGNVAMIGFFVLSGFVLGYRYSKEDLLAWDALSAFYKRHFLRLMPLYWLFALSYMFLGEKMPLTQALVLAPVELFGSQSWVTGLFSISHNGGTWFVSCLLFCYLLFPILLETARRCVVKVRLLFLGAFCLLVLYASMRTSATMLALPDVYSNPFCRAIEFGFGVGAGLLFAFVHGGGYGPHLAGRVRRL